MLRLQLQRLMLAVAVVLLPMQIPAVAGEKVNVNTATVEQLEQVKGIGAKTAAAIVSYRKEHGRFANLDELTKVKGIGEKKLEQIKDALTVGDAPSHAGN